MTGIRLTSVIVAALACGGAWATPIRTAESTRMRTSIVRCVADLAARQVERRVLAAPVDPVAPPEVLGTAITRAPRPSPLPHALYHRPPPTS